MATWHLVAIRQSLKMTEQSSAATITWPKTQATITRFPWVAISIMPKIRVTTIPSQLAATSTTLRTAATLKTRMIRFQLAATSTTLRTAATLKTRMIRFQLAATSTTLRTAAIPKTRTTRSTSVTSTLNELSSFWVLPLFSALYWLPPTETESSWF